MQFRRNNMATVTKEEYLKRYMSGASNDNEKTKKKKRKTAQANSKSRFKIVDDDVDVKALIPKNVNNTLDEDIDADKPTVADFVDERPKEQQILEKYRNDDRWKLLSNEKEETFKKTNRRRHDSDTDENRENTSDTSPSRRTRYDSDLDTSPQRRKQRDSDLDTSPQRRKRHDSDLDTSRQRRKRHDSDLDTSPRRNRHDSDLDTTPPRRNRHDSDLDTSPPRRKRHDSDLDTSPQRRNRNDSDLDTSPPRIKRHDSDLDASPPRRKRQDSDLDTSPPRRKRHNSDDDATPKHRKRHNSDHSPSRSKRTVSSKSCESRKRRGSDSDSTPHRKKLAVHTEGGSVERHKRSHRNSPHSDSTRTRAEGDYSGNKGDKGEKKMRQTLGGAKAGLSTAREVRDETNRLKQKEDEMFSKLDAEVLGKNARTVFRDKKSGRKRNLEEEEEIEAEKAKKKSVRDAKYNEWGKGLAQKAKQEANVQEALHEVSKPLTRYKDDNDLDTMLKDQDRQGDPMLAFMKKKKKASEGKTKALPRYSGPQPLPNRFNIWPGYRWDGVNRTNGFEKKLTESKVNKQAVAEIAYKWSTEDM